MDARRYSDRWRIKIPMKNKTDTWVVLRFDGPSRDLEDHVAVKGVYDSELQAKSAVARLADGAATQDKYVVILSRRFTDAGAGAISSAANRAPVQGLVGDEVRWNWLWADPSRPHSLEAAVSVLPDEVRRQVLRPLISYHAESTVARALGAHKPKPDEQGDLVLSNGKIVEVKVVFLDPHKAKSPFVQFRSSGVDYLVFVLVDPSFAIFSATLVPASVARVFERTSSGASESQVASLRITPDLLKAPGTSSIDLTGSTPVSQNAF